MIAAVFALLAVVAMARAYRAGAALRGVSTDLDRAHAAGAAMIAERDRLTEQLDDLRSDVVRVAGHRDDRQQIADACAAVAANCAREMEFAARRSADRLAAAERTAMELGARCVVLEMERDEALASAAERTAP